MNLEKGVLLATKIAVATILGAPEVAVSTIGDEIIDNVIPCPIDDHSTYGVEMTD